jgi:osmotically-inducible protein OsmY
MRTPLILIVLVAALLQGCAAVVATGAATGAVAIYDRRTTGIMLEDQNIELKTASRLRSDPAISEQAHINTTSFNLTVLLTGEELAVAAPSSMTARASDTLITSKVKTGLLNIDLPEYSPERVKVVTEAGAVYLMGLVTQPEANATIEKARRVGGVQRVVNVFEYVD